jgi:hypothetical protein
METIPVNSIDDLETLLSKNCLYANGKNMQIDHLHATGAVSRFDRENMYGIYVARPEYAWMAVWMGVVDRKKSKKRDITYCRPRSPDVIGSIRLYAEHDISRDHLCEESFVYLLDVRAYPAMDIRSEDNHPRITDAGFQNRLWRHHGTEQENYVHVSDLPMIVHVDFWQSVLVNVPRIIPTQELHLGKGLIDELFRTRVTAAPGISGEEYVLQ